MRKGLALAAAGAVLSAAPVFALEQQSDPQWEPLIAFFDWDAVTITKEAAAILDHAAQTFARIQAGQVTVIVGGDSDRSGSEAYNMLLSQRRADAVKLYLADHGVPAAALSTQAFGETRPLVETPDDVREPQNRRVEISVGPGRAGWSDRWRE